MKVKLDPGAYMPERAHATDAGLDLRTMNAHMLWPGESAVFDTGVHVQFPKGYYGKLESKSGLNVNHNIVSCGGVIDEGYTGSIKVKLYNLGQTSHFFAPGDKIVQLIVQPYSAPEMELVSHLDESERGDDGFGSTGR